jgi:hypothetical protein
MKRFLLIPLLVFCSLPAFAQTRKDTAVYVTPTTGGKDEHRRFFDEMLPMEVGARGYTVVNRSRDAEYILTAALSVEDLGGNPTGRAGAEGESGAETDSTGTTDEGAEADEPFNILHIGINENKDGHVVAEQDLYYRYTEDTYEILPLMIFNMVANIPLSRMINDEEWRNKWLYFSGVAMWTPRIYINTENSQARATSLVQFGAALGAEFRFLDFMSAQLEVDITVDDVSVRSGTFYQSPVIEVPLMLKFPIKPKTTRHFLLEPYAGVQFNAALTSETSPPLVSVFGGFDYGVKAGPGAIVFDTRVTADIGNSRVDSKTEPTRLKYSRYSIKIGVGYKIGFVNRGRKL